jgi:CheY-like chemotaxis protein
MDGIALFERLQQTYPDLPVIFITGADANLAGRSVSATEAHIHKPFSPETMIEVIISMTLPAITKAD